MLGVEAALLEETCRRVVGVGEQVQHAQRERVLLEAREQPRAHAVALLLLAHDAECDLEESARAVRLDDDAAQHAAHLAVVGGAHEQDGLVVGCEGELGRVGLADERQRRVDHLEQLAEQADVLLARAVVGDHDRVLGATLGLLRLALILEHLRGDGA